LDLRAHLAPHECRKAKWFPPQLRACLALFEQSMWVFSSVIRSKSMEPYAALTRQSASQILLHFQVV
jgi:hypothetical protein